MAVLHLPSFDLVLATVDREHDLELFLDSLERQSYRRFRVVLIDQNDDDRVTRVLAGHSALEIVPVFSARGLSRARNAGLTELQSDVVAFPDDDCEYPDDLLERVAERLAADSDLGGITGRSADRAGRSSPSWKSDARLLTRTNLWNRGISYAIFLRRNIVDEVGAFDEQLGLGSQAPWSSGEEIDFLIRAVSAGARIAYDPDLVVFHEQKLLSTADRRALGYRDGESIGYILRKHRYGPLTLLGMFIRPLGGALLSLARLDGARARFHLATLRGRLAGYLGQPAAAR